MGDDERASRIDTLLTELVSKIGGWGESLSEFKCQMQRACERRADTCRADFEDIFIRLRTAETNIASVTTLVEVIKSLIEDKREDERVEKKTKPHWAHTAVAVTSVLINLLVLALIGKVIH